MLPPLAEHLDLEARYPNLDLDIGQAAVLLEDASAMVRAYAGRTWVNEDGELDGVPDGVRGIVCAVVARAVGNQDGVTQETVGPFNRSFGAQAADRMYLSRTEKLTLRGGQRAFTVDPTPDVPVGWLGGP